MIYNQISTEHLKNMSLRFKRKNDSRITNCLR
ncbi:hypothetical protein BVI2075_580039 [Burkholderia vietnamiensis]|nr:hypothetical protein BVI2075_580039 [Burkholderia vietnamiensis]